MPTIQGTVPNFQQLDPWNLRLHDSLWPGDSVFGVLVLFLCHIKYNFSLFLLVTFSLFYLFFFHLFLSPLLYTSFLFCLYPTLSFPFSFFLLIFIACYDPFFPIFSQFFLPKFTSVSSFIPLSLIPIRHKTLRILAGLACHRSWEVFPAAPSFIWQVVIEAWEGILFSWNCVFCASVFFFFTSCAILQAVTKEYKVSWEFVPLLTPMWRRCVTLWELSPIRVSLANA